jgi:hypothetical protein
VLYDLIGIQHEPIVLPLFIDACAIAKYKNVYVTGTGALQRIFSILRFPKTVFCAG